MVIARAASVVRVTLPAWQVFQLKSADGVFYRPVQRAVLPTSGRFLRAAFFCVYRRPSLPD